MIWAACDRRRDLVRERLEQIDAPGDDSRLHALRREACRDGAADAGAGSRNQRGLTFELAGPRGYSLWGGRVAVPPPGIVTEMPASTSRV